MAIFANTRTNVTLVPGTDVMTTQPSSDRHYRLKRVTISGMGVTSNPVEIMVARSTGGSLAGNSESGRPVEPDTDLANYSIFWDWTTQPTITENLFSIIVNADGGTGTWESRDNGADSPADVNRVGEQLSFRVVQGTGPISMTIFIEDDAS